MTDPLFAPLPKPQLDWEDNQPFSRDYDDVYFSRDDGVAETEHVFIRGNGLERRWQQLNGASFTLGETGFGTGLNFLLALDRWLKLTASGTLHYFSVEMAPLSKEDFLRAAKQWPQLEPIAITLADQYPLPLPGFHRISLPDYRCELTLMYGEATDCLSSLSDGYTERLTNSFSAAVDAWFLDGFAPSRNPDMWRPALFQSIAALSRKGTTLATFTSAGIVKRGLREAGFDIQKAPGFGSKRDMVTGEFQFARGTANPDQTGNRTAAVRAPWHVCAEQHPIPQHVAVIGAGIAGCATAAALAKKGIHVSLIMPTDKVADGASGNPQGILYPKPSVRMGNLSRFALAALSHATNFYQPFREQQQTNGDPAAARCGVLLLPESDTQKQTFQNIAQAYPPELMTLLEGQSLANMAGIELSATMGLFFPELGWIHPPTICDLLSQHPRITRICRKVSTLDMQNNQWVLIDESLAEIVSADAVVIACGHNSSIFNQTNHLPIKPVRGQITHIPANHNSEKLRTVICGEGYIAPAVGGIHTLGATYDLQSDSDQYKPEDNNVNLSQLNRSDPALAKVFSAIEPATLAGRASVRCTTPDYLPIAGPAPMRDEFLRQYDELRRNAKADIPEPGRCWPGLYINTGHGSRGMTYAPLCAEIIASQLCGEFPPVEQALVQSVHPARFLIRDLIRNRV
ncbi:MAG: bifunctional tRNA (5-methylaminomethyl-2-thiouridine)(34)-methyltransferase MnmD/FAD-dependent 5-carboxymethylaminomethyl-2-thiouridine(34) oxidoreductase MnmC [bacterium]